MPACPAQGTELALGFLVLLLLACCSWQLSDASFLKLPGQIILVYYSCFDYLRLLSNNTWLDLQAREVMAQGGAMASGKCEEKRGILQDAICLSFLRVPIPSLLFYLSSILHIWSYHKERISGVWLDPWLCTHIKKKFNAFYFLLPLSPAVKSWALLGTATPSFSTLSALQGQVEIELCSRTVMCLQDVYSKE